MQPDEVQIVEPRRTSDNHRQNYQKFMSNVYDTIKQKQFTLKKGSLSDIPASLPKLSGKDFTISYNDDNFKAVETVRIRNGAHPSSRGKVFKSFMSHINEQQKKINTDTMSLLGLEVKKLSGSETVRLRVPERHQEYLQNQQQDISGNENRQNPVEGTKEMSKYNPIDLLCRKIDISQRNIPATSKWTQNIANSGSFRMKDRMGLLTSGSKNQRSRTSEKTRKGKIDQNQKGENKKIRLLANPDFVNPIYEGRFSSYRELVFKLNFAHNVYTQITKYDAGDVVYLPRNDLKYKAYVGPGNNGKLIVSLIKRRFWWSVIEDRKLDQANFVWSQLKVNDFFKKQQPAMFVGHSVSIASLIEKNKHQNIQRSSSANQSKRKNRLKKNKEKQPLPDEKFFYKIFTECESFTYNLKISKAENKTYPQKKQILGLKTILNSQQKVHNHLINNFYLGNKKALFYCLKEYYDLIEQNPFKKIPLTFHIKKGFNDQNYKRFISYFKKRHAYIKQQQNQMNQGDQVRRKMRNVWIIKPGELTNRGHGITVIDQIYQLNSIIKRQGKHENGCQKTFIVQLYLDRPFLYQRRKFDLRHYILITHLHGAIRGYWFEQGYIRTSSYEFDIENFEREIHLTNDAVQKHTPLYGKYEPGNKISYSDFQRYLDVTYPKKKYSFSKTILPQMKQISLDAIKSSFLKLSPQRLKHNFEIFGLDFMIDCDFKPWLIEINTNPCLEISCPLLARLIPQMLDQALRLSLDVIFPPPCHYPNTAKHLVPEAGLENLKFQLIFEEKRDGPQIRSLYKQNTPNNLLEEIGDISDDQVYDDDGKDIILDQLFDL